MRSVWACLVLFVLTLCTRTSAPPEEVIVRYKADADRFCAAIVDCMKEDVRKRMAHEPERRDMILRRMDRDLCVKGQHVLIGQSSVDLTTKKPAYNPEHYKVYSHCADAVARAKDCAERMRLYQDLPECRTVRGKS